MTRKELGQLFLVGFDGCEVDAAHPVVRAIREDGVGGVILFDRNVDGSRQNIRSPSQLRDLIAVLQSFADAPLLIAVDQEGGKVCRLKERDGFPATVSAGRLGALDDLAETRKRAADMAQILAECGVNLNLAPVIDLDLQPDNPIIGRYERSFAADPEKVTRHAAVFMEEHEKRGVACCVKHFPGHGSSVGDTHRGFVEVTGLWSESELIPYRRLLASGKVEAVMAAHVVHRGLDLEGLPATLSPAVIRGLLRKQLGFCGVVISDDLQMRAISDHWSYEEAVCRAVEAGVDLLIVGNNLVRTHDAARRGTAALREWAVGEPAREIYLREALERISRFKQAIVKTRKKPHGEHPA